jgi:predicted RNase H-like HicB family nuclease
MSAIGPRDATQVATAVRERIEHAQDLYRDVEEGPVATREATIEPGSRMETVTVESISITLGREDDGRWWADIESMPGVMACGDTRESAIAAVHALALRVAADCIDHGEQVPAPLDKVLSAA